MGTRQWLRGFGAGVLVASGLLLVGPSLERVHAQTTTVDFLVPETAGQASRQSCVVRAALPTEPGDRVVFTGRSTTTADGGNCAPAPGQYPVQDVVAIDPGGGRATRFCGVIVLQATAVSPGTKLIDISGVAECAAGGQFYLELHGTVE